VYLMKPDKLNGSKLATVSDMKKAETSEAVRKDVPTSDKPKLPKLYLPKFSGDITQFQTFWDSLLRQSILIQTCQ